LAAQVADAASSLGELADTVERIERSAVPFPPSNGEHMAECGDVAIHRGRVATVRARAASASPPRPPPRPYWCEVPPARLFSPWHGAALYGNQFKPLRESSGMLSETFVV